MFIEKASSYFAAIFSSTEFLIFERVVFAGLCAAVIGYERESAYKVAGIRTHIVVAIAAAVITGISMYGLGGLVASNEYMKLDPSRIIAGIVTGIGFLGTGAILIQENRISGLTTSAGLWAVCGIGIAIAAGMYILGVCTTLLLFAIQVFSHSNLYALLTPSPHILYISVSQNEKDFPALINALFKKYPVKRTKILMEEFHRDNTTRYKVKLHLHNQKAFQNLLDELKQCKAVTSITVFNQRFTN